MLLRGLAGLLPSDEHRKGEGVQAIACVPTPEGAQSAGQKALPAPVPLSLPTQYGCAASSQAVAEKDTVAGA